MIVTFLEAFIVCKGVLYFFILFSTSNKPIRLVGQIQLSLFNKGGNWYPHHAGSNWSSTDLNMRFLTSNSQYLPVYLEDNWYRFCLWRTYYWVSLILFYRASLIIFAKDSFSFLHSNLDKMENVKFTCVLMRFH